MILDGPNTKHQIEQTETTTTSIAFSISQLLKFNSVKHARKESTGSVRHYQCRETLLPLYLSMKIHAPTRSRRLVDTLHSLGRRVSYDRLLQVSSNVTNGICQRFLILGDAVCPSKLPQNLFTTAAVDNIEHNPSSGTASTGISLIQHPGHTHGGLDRGVEQPLFTMLKEIQWTFSRPSVKTKSKQKDQLAALKSDCGLFSRLTFLVKQDMGIWKNSSLMKTIPLHQLYQQVANCELE